MRMQERNSVFEIREDFQFQREFQIECVFNFVFTIFRKWNFKYFSLTATLTELLSEKKKEYVA